MLRYGGHDLVNRRLTDQFQLRLPTGLRDKIKAAASENDRSMNAEIIATLEEAYGSEDQVVVRHKFGPMTLKTDELLERLDDIKKDIAALREKD